VENLLEMGYVHVKNLLPNQLYENVLTPTELRRDMPVDRQRTVRVYSRERARVGGISVKVSAEFLRQKRVRGEDAIFCFIKGGILCSPLFV
jgi:hypothetical protein